VVVCLYLGTCFVFKPFHILKSVSMPRNLCSVEGSSQRCAVFSCSKICLVETTEIHDGLEEQDDIQ
jgi:hypothetical protein